MRRRAKRGRGYPLEVSECLLTVVLAPLASAWTSSNLPVPIVPPATSLPLATRSGTLCAMHVCKLPSMTIQGGAVHMLKLNGTSTCSLGESMDLKHATDLEAPPDVPVWDNLPHPRRHAPSRPRHRQGLLAPAYPIRICAPLTAAPHWGRSSRIRRAVRRAPAAHTPQPRALSLERLLLLGRRRCTRTKPTSSRRTISVCLPRR